MSADPIRTILFDWGNTLMLELPYAGAMAEWPEVALVEGAADTLAALAPRYRLAIASNAGASDQAAVLRAMGRVGLDHFFAAAFTPAEVGARKPDPLYFTRILDRLGEDAGAVVMVGDSYPVDVLGAHSAGLLAAWLNPPCEEALPDFPHQDFDLQRLLELPAALEAPRLPDEATCLAWMAEQGAPPNLLAHVRAVAWAAYRLAVGLRHAGHAVDPVLAHRGGILHDLDKLSSRAHGAPHGELSAELLYARGQPALAEIARRHIISKIQSPHDAPRTWEEKLVFYADKLVEGSRLVFFAERLVALRQRYPQYAPEMEASAPAVWALEAEISAALGRPAPEYLGIRPAGAA